MIIKKPLLFRAGAFLLVLSMLTGCADDGEYNPHTDTSEPVVTSSEDITIINDIDISEEVNIINGVLIVDDDVVVYDDDNGLSIKIEPASDKDISTPTQTGNTRGGSNWKAADDEIIIDNKKVTVLCNDKNKDNGKVAAITEALTAKNGYKKGTDDYNHSYAVYYIEVADCLLYYPKQLNLIKEGEDSSLIFRDSRSSAELRVWLGENSYACMDDVESFIKNTEHNRVLASGNDWYSCETSGTAKTVFTLTGLGNKFSVNAELTYENKYDFVFEELRRLIKCKFVDDGVWVSNAFDNSYKKVDAVAKETGAYDPVLKRTSCYIEEFDCVVAYPDIFTKEYFNLKEEYAVFTDPVTGASVTVMKMLSEESISDIQSQLEGNKSDLVSDHSLKAANDTEVIFVTIRDGYMWIAMMKFDEQYSGIYSNAYDMLEICIEGDDVNNTEMKEIYFPAFGCYATVPVQFMENGTDGDVHLFKDKLTGLEARLSLTAVTDASVCDNLYELFEVVAEDAAVTLGEDYVKWHNNDGLFLGAAGREYMGLLELTNPNAYDVYKNCWQDFGLFFSAGNELITDAEEIRKETAAVILMESTAEEQQAAEEFATEDAFAMATETDRASDSNIVETLVENKVELSEKVVHKPQTEVENNSDNNENNVNNEQRKVLFYKTRADYLDVTTTADEWLYAYPETFKYQWDIRLARYYTILYSVNVLMYNGYDIADKVDECGGIFDIADKTDEYLNILIYEQDTIKCQLGDKVISVFEVLCAILEIDTPIYVIEGFETQGSQESNGSQADTSGGDNNFDNEISTPKELYHSLPFEDVDGLIEESSYYGELTVLKYEPAEATVNGIYLAMEELIELGFEYTETEDTQWYEMYLMEGYIPDTQTEMLIFIYIDEYNINILYLISEVYFFGAPGSLAYDSSLDYYDLDFLSEIGMAIEANLNSIIEYEKSNDIKDMCYMYSYGFMDPTKYDYDSFVQGSFTEDDPFSGRDGSIIYSGYYDNNEFVIINTYFWLEVEGFTLVFDRNGVAQII